MESGDEIGDFGVHQGSLDGKVRQLLTQTRAVRDDVLAVDGLHTVSYTHLLIEDKPNK